MDNNEKIILVPKSKEKVNQTKTIVHSLDANKFIILILIIITCIQFFVINILLLKSNKNENLEKIEYINSNAQIEQLKQRRFLYKEDNKTNIETNKAKIHIAMALDSRSIYQTLVSVTSALENNNKNENILIFKWRN